MKKKSSPQLIVVAALVANLAVGCSKFTAAYFTGSSSMLSEAIHSMVDTLNEVLLLWGRKRSTRPPDDFHPFGYGMELYFWSLIVAVLLFGMGGGMSIYEGIMHILHPAPIEHLYWSYGVLAFAFLSEGTSFLIASKAFNRHRRRRGIWEAFRGSKNPSIYMVLAEDLAAMLGLGAAFLGISASWFFGMPVFDGIASCVIGLILGMVALLLAYESRDLLLGESARSEIRERVKTIALSQAGVEWIGPPLTMHFGPDEILLNMELRFREPLDVADSSVIVAHIEDCIRLEIPQIKRIFIKSLPSSETQPHV